MGDLCMGSAKLQKTSTSSRRPISRDLLFQKMSEIISLREKVAQAELAAHSYGQGLGQIGEELKE
jgi:hypothetical protein